MPELNFPVHPDLKELRFALNLSPEEAVKYMQAKGYAFSFNWREVWQEAHHKAFTVAKAMNIEVLQEIRKQVQRSIDEGITFGEFQKQLEPTLQNLGWWGKSYMVNPNSGAVEGVQLGSPRRLKTIYRTNLSVAYSVGRYKQMAENTKHRPYWMYNATLDKRTRPAHAALHGKVFHYSDPIWEKIYPPNDWGCRCWVRPLTKSEVESMGLQVADPGTIKIPPHFAPEEWQYNPGKTAWYPDFNKYDDDLSKKYVNDILHSEVFEAFYNGASEGNFPVAVLDNSIVKKISAKTNTALLSNTTLAKNKFNHPDLEMLDYQNLNELINASQVIVQDGENTLVFIQVGQKIYHAVIKATASGKALFLTSFRYSSKADISRVIAKGTVIRNELE